jgi:hypothetical protein
LLERAVVALSAGHGRRGAPATSRPASMSPARVSDLSGGEGPQPAAPRTQLPEQVVWAVVSRRPCTSAPGGEQAPTRPEAGPVTLSVCGAVGPGSFRKVNGSYKRSDRKSKKKRRHEIFILREAVPRSVRSFATVAPKPRTACRRARAGTSPPPLPHRDPCGTFAWEPAGKTRALCYAGRGLSFQRGHHLGFRLVACCGPGFETVRRSSPPPRASRLPQPAEVRHAESNSILGVERCGVINRRHLRRCNRWGISLNQFAI